jgi:hypothetical protein
MCTFSFLCEIRIHKYHIDGKHVRVYHSRICRQTSFMRWRFPNMGIEGVSLPRLTSTKIIYYNRHIQNNDICTI